MKLTGAQALIKSLEQEGVEVMFGIPGGTIMPAYDPLIESGIRHILCRHEQGAGHAASGYAHVTGRTGVCMATSGPGACNLVTALADAKMDSVPLVAITGQVATPAVGNDSFQEADITGITLPVTKHNMLVTATEDLPRAVREAFHIASTGRPGPVLIDIPKDVLFGEAAWHWPQSVDLPGYKPTVKGNLRQIREAVRLIMESKRPVLYVGGGVMNADASSELYRLATEGRLPVVTTLMARGAFPDSNPLCLGMPGMHGNYTAVTAMQKADLLVSLGARFDDRVTGKLSGFAPGAKVVHADIDPAEIGKIRKADVPIVGDAKDIVGKMVAEQERLQGEAGGPPDRSEWLETLAGWKQKYPLTCEQPSDGPVKPQFVIERMCEATKGDAIAVSGVGQNQMWTSQHWRFERSRSWVTSGGLGTMGYGLPAAMGAKVGRPDERVVLFDGDGCIQMTVQELATMNVQKIPVIVSILNNGYLGMVRQWQEMFFDERYSEVYLGHDVPDYVKLAEAYGAVGLRAESPEEVDPVIEKALAVEDRTVVIDFRCDEMEKVFPMVPAGASNDEIMLGPGRLAHPPDLTSGGLA